MSKLSIGRPFAEIYMRDKVGPDEMRATPRIARK